METTYGPAKPSVTSPEEILCRSTILESSGGLRRNVSAGAFQNMTIVRVSGAAKPWAMHKVPPGVCALIILYVGSGSLLGGRSVLVHRSRGCFRLASCNDRRHAPKHILHIRRSACRGRSHCLNSSCCRLDENCSLGCWDWLVSRCLRWWWQVRHCLLCYPHKLLRGSSYSRSIESPLEFSLE